MTRYGRRIRVLAAAMAAQAGFVDALGFLQLGGWFVSFMSGNATRMGVALASHRDAVAIAAGLIALFVVGVIVGTFIGRSTERHRIARVQAAVTLLLAAAAIAQAASDVCVSIGLVVLAMGAANAAFERDGEVAIGVTYVTGALVKMGQHLASALSGGDRTAWLWQALMWLGLTAGATAGALAFAAWGLASLWVSTATGAVLTLAAHRIERTSRVLRAHETAR